MSYLIAARTGLMAACLLGLISCVDPVDRSTAGRLNVLVVDGTVTNLAEAQIIRLNRSLADPLTGLPGVLPVTKAQVEVVVDSTQVVAAAETEDGTYQLPSDFKGQTGHDYQIRIRLADGSQYLSTTQRMPPVPAISQLTARFNPKSLPVTQLGGFQGAHELRLTTQDPAEQTNYYRWDWTLWETQDWCRSCAQGRYSVNNVATRYASNGIQLYYAGDSLLEDCFYPPPPGQGGPVLESFVYDYPCRTQCWAILHSRTLNVFSDVYSNGGLISSRPVAQIPFYQRSPCLVEIRQSSLTASAYQFYQQLDQQSQKSGGVADTPATLLAGNIRNVADSHETVVGVFTASSVATKRYWLDRRDTQGIPIGLFEALYGRSPNPEPSIPNQINKFQIIWSKAQPPFSAVCTPSLSQTPNKPTGWLN